MTGSGEEELPGSVGGISDIGELESQAVANSGASQNSASSGSGDFPSTSSNSVITPRESLLQQVLPDVSSGSGVSDKEEESLPGSVGGQVNLDESQSGSNMGSGAEAVQIVNPASTGQHEGSGVATTENGSGESSKAFASIPLDSIVEASYSSGSGNDQQLDGSGATEKFQSLEIPSSDDETLPGSVGAVGPNLMTMASPENKGGSGVADQSGAGSGTGSGMQDELKTMKAFSFTDSFASGSGQVEKSDNETKSTTVRTKVEKPVKALNNENKNN